MDDAEFAGLDLWWRAANYLSVGQIYLLANPLLREPLRIDHVKPRLLGHWGTTPGLNFIYAHLNRVIRARDLDMIYVCGPGHGGPGMVANTWLEGSYTELVPGISRDGAGMQRLFKQFCFPGGIPSHDAPNVPGSINEGGELGYSLLHAAGAVFDNPDLIAACVVGDGEAETGPLATSWHCTKFLNPARDGAVLPILHLNGYKIAGPTVLARIPEAELLPLFRGYGWDPVLVAGDDPAPMHPAMAAALDGAWTASPPSRPRRGSPAALADDHPALAQGLDRPEDGGQQAGRGHLARPPGAARQAARPPGAAAPAGGVDALLPAGGAVRRATAARVGAITPRRPRASAAWAPTRTPTAACCCATWTCRTSALRRRRRAPGARRRGDPRAGRVPARRHGGERTTSACSARTRPPATG